MCVCVRQSSLGSGDESDDGDVKKKEMRAKTRKEKKHEAESRLNYHLEQYRLLFSQNGCSCSLPAKGLASAPKIYRSKHFQVCTHPRLQCPLI